MTRKLTDEQVKNVSKISFDKDLKFYIESIDKHFTIAYADRDSYNVYLDFSSVKKGLNKSELLVYLEELLNKRYCWLPQNNGWIMSGEVYNFANGGVNKVLELVYLAKMKGGDWYCVEGVMMRGLPFPSQYAKGITIPADSPIWDAVKGLSDD